MCIRPTLATYPYANGQSTQMTQTAVERLNRGLELDAVVVPSWSMLTLTAAGSRTTVLTAAVSPTAINMRRVATMMAVVDRAALPMHVNADRLSRRGI